MNASTSMNRGFTLLEMLMVLAIILIGITLAAPAISELVQKIRLRAATQKLFLDLLHARSQALHQGRVVVVCGSDDGRKCATHSNWHNGWLVFVDANNDRDYQEGDTLLRVAGRQTSIRAESGIHRGRLRFYSDGSAVGSAASIRLCSAGSGIAGRKIVLANSGRIRIEHGGSGADFCSRG